MGAEAIDDVTTLQRGPARVLPPISRGPAETAHSGIREIAEVALRTPGCIRLEVGEPNFPTPRRIAEAAASAAFGRVGYTATAGLPSLREKISLKLLTVNGISAGLDEINCTVGGAGAIAAAVAAVVEPGDEILLPDPGWPNYRLMLAWAHGVMVPYACHPRSDFLPDPDEIERLITKRTKLLVINSPANPTGAVFPTDLMERLIDLCVRHNVYLLSDECYDQIVLEGQHTSPAAICSDGRVISAFSFSKTYAMTGWRVGYVVANKKISDTITKILESNSSCLSTVCQKAAEAALDGPALELPGMLAEYRRRRDLAVRALSGAGILISKPHGAFYIMADIARSQQDARSFALELLDRRGVAVAPGTAFGKVGRDSVRLSLASSSEDLARGIDRLVAELHVRDEGANGSRDPL